MENTFKKYMERLFYNYTHNILLTKYNNTNLINGEFIEEAFLKELTEEQEEFVEIIVEYKTFTELKMKYINATLIVEPLGNNIFYIYDAENAVEFITIKREEAQDIMTTENLMKNKI